MSSALRPQLAPDTRLKPANARERRHARRSLAALTAERDATLGYVVVPNPAPRGTVAKVVLKSSERRRLEAEVRAAKTGGLAP